MKKLQLISLFMVICWGLSAQQIIASFIYVVDTNNAPLANYPVNFSDFPNNGPSTFKTTLTDANGFIFDSAYVQGSGYYWIDTDSSYCDTAYYYYSGSPSWVSFTDTITVCNQISPPCSFSISAQPITTNPPTQGFYSFNTTYQGTTFSNYLWDFGDGKTSAGMSPNHKYSMVGTYIYCLTVDNCPTVCDTIVVTSANNCNYNISHRADWYDSTYNFKFYNSHLGNPNSQYLWLFGDGDSSTVHTPEHAYAQTGTYYVSLQADSCAPVYDTVIVYSRKPVTVSGLMLDPQGNGVAGHPYNLSVRYDVNPPINGANGFYISFYHNYGNLNLISDQNGQYSTTLYQVQYPGLSNNDIRVDIGDTTCPNNPWVWLAGPYHPIQVGTSPQAFTDTFNLGCAPVSANCNYTVSANQTPGTNGYFFTSTHQNNPLFPSTYLWSFGDGNTSNQTNPTHAYSQPGTYIYCLQVDSCPPVCDTITITGTPGNCDASYTYQASGLNVYLTLPNVGGVNGSLSVNWGNGQTYNVASGSLPSQVGNIYTTAGTYSVCATVYDSINNCTDFYCDTIVLPAQTPTCNGYFTSSNSGNTVSINPVSVGSTGTLWLNWGDGVVDSVEASAIPVVPYNHTYSSTGTYTVCVLHSITPSFVGCNHTYCDTVVITSNSPLQCHAEYVVDTVNSQPGTVILWNTSNVLGGNPNSTQVSFYWDFGDGTSSTQAYPTHNYSNPGTYAICLTIAALDSMGTGVATCTSTHCDTITVDQNGNLIYKGAIMGWTLKVLDPNTIGVDEDALSDIEVYPNPAKDYLKLHNPSANEVSYQLLNTNGQLVQAGIAQDTETTIEMTNLASGIYILQVQVEQDHKQFKIVKW